MLVPYIRSSSLNQFKFCQMRYTLEYLFGFKSVSGKAAMLGTIFHKCQELRAVGGMKLRAGIEVFQDDNFGEVNTLDALNPEWCLDKAFPYYTSMQPDLNVGQADKKTIAGWIQNVHEKHPNYDMAKLNVVATEQFFDIEIPHDWAKYSEVINGQKIEGQLRIKGTMDTIVDLGHDTYELVDYKGLPVDTPILTINGFVSMGDLKVGDIVFDQFGQQTKVIAKSDQKFKECYKITFDDTSEVICDDEHYWKLHDGKVVQIKNLCVGDKINVAKPVEYPYIDLPIDPYVLGLWLGDGRNRCGEVSSADIFCFEEVTKRGFDIGKDISCKDKICKSRTIYGLTTKLKKLNLLHNKHIPEIYLKSSYSQRLDLLRGLMDSDGSVNIQRKQCIFMNCTKRLSENVKELLLSLGQRPLLSKTNVPYNNTIVNAFPVSFRPIDINPFLLPRKRNKIDSSWGNGYSNLRKIRKIEKCGIKLTQCISVDSPDKTYLCTHNMIPTHNTGSQFKDFATGEEKSLEYFKDDIQLLLYLIALRALWPDKNWILTLFYTNIDGMYSVIGDDEMLGRAWDMLRSKFEEITACKKPTQFDPYHRDWRCKYTCVFSKPMEGTNKSICQHYKSQIDLHGLSKVQDEVVNINKLMMYQDGGGRKADA